jgi:hypothetical protein
MTAECRPKMARKSAGETYSGFESHLFAIILRILALSFPRVARLIEPREFSL